MEIYPRVEIKSRTILNRLWNKFNQDLELNQVDFTNFMWCCGYITALREAGVIGFYEQYKLFSLTEMIYYGKNI